MLRSITITVTVDDLNDEELDRLRARLNDFVDCGAQYININIDGHPGDAIGLAEVLSDVQRRLSLRRGMISARTKPVAS